VKARLCPLWQTLSTQLITFHFSKESFPIF
jgi:hypothetical protein